MSDVLGRLVDRALGSAEGLRPRLPSRFEPADGAGPAAGDAVPGATAATAAPGTERDSTDRLTAGPGRARGGDAATNHLPGVRPRLAGVPVDGEPPGPPGGDLDPPGRSPTAGSPVRTVATAPATSRPRPDPASTSVPDERAGRIERPPAASWATPSEVRVAPETAVGVPASAAHGSMLPAGRVPADPPGDGSSRRHPSSAAESPEPAAGAVTRVAHRLPAAGPPTRAAGRVAADLRIRPAPVEPDRPVPGRPGDDATRAGDRPVVRISIGRIEVRAVQAPPPPRRSQAPAPPAAPSLEAYLRARNGGAR